MDILKTITKNGFLCEELVSALQKYIRRGYEEEAATCAYELFLSGEQYEDLLWSRLLVISVEDIGMGNPMASVIVSNLNQMRQAYAYNEDPDRPLFMIHAIVLLCRSEKNRASALLKSIVKRNMDAGRVGEIPDFALDMHTERGRQMGRERVHFLTEASQVSPEQIDNRGYKQRLIEMIRNER